MASEEKSFFYKETPDGVVPCEACEVDFASPSRIVGKTTVNSCLVSTMFLGVDHNYGAGPPLLYETMVFDGDGKEVFCERYSTRSQALRGHKRTVEWVEEKEIIDGE